MTKTETVVLLNKCERAFCVLATEEGGACERTPGENEHTQSSAQDRFIPSTRCYGNHHRQESVRRGDLNLGGKKSGNIRTSLMIDARAFQE